jgi:hypothetical protein
MHMAAETRYKVKLPDSDAYGKALHLLRGRVPVYVTSERRHFLSVGKLGLAMRYRLKRLGGSVVPEHRYDLDNAAGRAR